MARPPITAKGELLFRQQLNAALDYVESIGGGATNLTYTAATRVIASDTGTDATLPLVSSGDAGLAPASGGGTTNFLRADGTWTAPGGGGLSDGDKGDITVTASGATWTIDAGAVTDAKIADVAWGKLTGIPAPVSALSGTNTGDQTSIVGITGTKAQFDTAVTDGNFLYVGDVTTNATHTGEVTGSGALTITAGAVTLAKMADVATASVFYRKTAGAGAPEVQTLATLKTDLGLTGTNSGDQTTIAGITGTKAQFDTAVTDGNFLYVGDVTSNATHTGDVTGATTLTIDPTAISGRTLVTAVGTDHILILDATDGLLKKALASDLAGAGGVSDGDKGDITVSGGGATWTIDNDTIGLDELSATGTPSATTYLRGDNSWATPAAAISATSGVGATPIASGTTTITHGLGRTPAIIRIYGKSGFTNNASATPTTASVGIYTSSGNACIFQGVNGTAAIAAVSSTAFAIQMNTSLNNFITGVIQNVGASSFDIVWTETGTHTRGVYLWEAM